MNAVRQPLDLRANVIMLVLCICWGFQQVAMKLVVGDVEPVMQIAVRSGIATLLLGLFSLWRYGAWTLPDRTLIPGLVAGLLFALEFLMIGEGLRRTSAAHMVVLIYTAPIFAALGLQVKLPEERLTGLQWLGVLTAFLGIVIAFLGRPTGQASDMLLGDLLGLASGLFWGVTTVVIRTTPLAEAPAVKTLLYQLATTFLLLTLVAVLTHRTHLTPSAAALLSLAFQTFIVALASLVAWFWLLRHYLASRLSVLTLLAPLFGVGFGVLILDEHIDVAFAVGSGLVLLGLFIVSGAKLLEERFFA